MSRRVLPGSWGQVSLNSTIIVDASNLQRNLYLVTQILEMRTPCVIALNMTDAAERAGLEIDLSRLSREIGVPIVPTIAVREQGIDALYRSPETFPDFLTSKAPH